ncbi:DUF4347 domain-containing protein, partial [Chromatium okenii]
MFASRAHAVLITDAQLQDLDQLLAGLDADVEPWLVASNQDAMPLIFKALAHPDLTQLHLLAHGAPGEIRLGERALTAADFRQYLNGAAMRDLSINFWSCHTGAGEMGTEFTHAVAAATGARVLAAEGLIGAANKQGSWELNGITAPFSETARAGYANVLAVRDRFEDNDTAATATNLGTITSTRTETGLSIETNDPDWFQFTLGSTGTSASNVAIDFSNALGDLDIFLYDAAGNALQGTYGSNDHEQISLSGLAAGSYLIKVRDWTSLDGGENPNYTLTLIGSGEVSPTVSYPTLDYMPDLTSSQMSGARSLTFAPYTSTSWDSKAGAYGSESGASSHSIYTITATAGQVYDLYSVSYFDPYSLTVYDSLGNAIVTNAESDDPADYNLGDAYYGVDWLNDWTAPYSGTYYVDASWHQGSYFTFYDLMIYKNKSTTVLPTLSLSSLSPSSVSEGNSGSTSMMVNVTRTGDLSSTSSASWSVVGAAATASDFLSGVLPTGTVNFAAGQASATATINIAGDTTIESDENFTVTLSNPVSATLDISSATGTIVNDDVSPPVPYPTLDYIPDLKSSQMYEADLLAFLPVTSSVYYDMEAYDYGLTSNASLHSLYQFNATTGVLYDIYSISYLDPTELTIYDQFGNAIAINNESDDPDNSTLSWVDDGGSYSFDAIWEWSAPYSGTFYVDSGWNQGSFFTYWDVSVYRNKSTTPSLPTLSLSSLTPTSISEGNSGYTPITFTVNRDGDLSGTSRVFFAVTGTGTNPVNAADFRDGVLPSDWIDFDSGAVSATITSYVVAGDTTPEPNENFTVTLSSPTGATLGTSTSVIGTITNDDSLPLPTISLSPLSPSIITEGHSGYTPVNIVVTRGGDLSSTSSATWTVVGTGVAPVTADDFGGFLPSGIISLAAGVATATVSINILGDTTVESNEDFTVMLSNPSGATLIPNTVTGTITNDDVILPTLSLASLTPSIIMEGNSGFTPMTVTITRSGDLSGTSAANWSVIGAGATADDFIGGVLPSGTISFPAWQATTTATINIFGDTLVESNENFSVVLAAPVGATLGTSTSAMGTINNDDTLPTINVAPVYAITEGNSGSTTVNVTVNRTGDLSTASSANWSVAGSGTTPAIGADFTGGVLPTGTVNFAAGIATASIAINVAGDTVFEQNENFTVSLNTPVNATLGASVNTTGTINNDDTLPVLN